MNGQKALQDVVDTLVEHGVAQVVDDGTIVVECEDVHPQPVQALHQNPLHGLLFRCRLAIENPPSDQERQELLAALDEAIGAVPDSSGRFA